MSYAAEVLRATLRRLLFVQVVLVLAVAVAFLALKGWPQGVAALFGGGIALFNTLVSAQRLRRASERTNDPQGSMLELYIGAGIRFVATPALVALGIILLDLDPVAIIVGFAVAQLGFFFNSARPPRPQN